MVGAVPMRCSSTVPSSELLSHCSCIPLATVGTGGGGRLVGCSETGVYGLKLLLCVLMHPNSRCATATFAAGWLKHWTEALTQ